MSNTAEVTRKGSHAEIAEALKKEAASNKVFSAVMLVFAVRERARAQVTVHSLKQTMHKEGYNFTTKDIEGVLTFLANVGVGKLAFDSKGKLRGLSEIRLKLQSVGKAAVGEAAKIEKYRQARRYTPLAESKLQSPLPRPVEQAVKEATREMEKIQAKVVPPSKHQVFISAIVNGRNVSFPTPMFMSADEIFELIAEMDSKAPTIGRGN